MVKGSILSRAAQSTTANGLPFQYARVDLAEFLQRCKFCSLIEPYHAEKYSVLPRLVDPQINPICGGQL